MLQKSTIGYHPRSHPLPGMLHFFVSRRQSYHHSHYDSTQRSNRTVVRINTNGIQCLILMNPTSTNLSNSGHPFLIWRGGTYLNITYLDRFSLYLRLDSHSLTKCSSYCLPGPLKLFSRLMLPFFAVVQGNIGTSTANSVDHVSCRECDSSKGDVM